ncbi:MAG TPA: glycoside hydrolase family 2 TIM barrel-domain containing protein [Verrucomicrobiae bacterium]|nr:glycoside hydrolase family 2 TIM barrel-domain containing protein [Verrucomicrobiae bacterium]
MKNTLHLLGGCKKAPAQVLALVAGLIVMGNCLASQPIATTGPAKVEVRQAGGRWQMFVNQKPFYIKGAGLEYGDQEKLVAAGGNSFRTWRTDNGQETGRQILDRAQKNGLYVTMGLDMARERQGFNYSNSNDVAQQLATIRAQVLEFKDHPALLMWDIGNELNLNSTNPAVWDAVNNVSKMIHQLDHNHPTTTSLAGASKDVLDQIKNRAPDLDLLCFQSYADIVNLQHYLHDAGWAGPYAVTEWGATGHWECGKTGWGAPIEDNSSVKANLYAKRYETAIAADTNGCLGSYVFLWGQKQERTPTWYGMFLPSGEATETVDVMEHLWTGRWPENRSPVIGGLWLDGKTAPDNVHLSAGQNYTAKIEARAASAVPLTYSFEIMEESGAESVGGDFESEPQHLAGLVSADVAGEAQVKAPTKPGAYRFFAYVSNGQGRAAYGNIPFYVDGKTSSVASRP